MRGVEGAAAAEGAVVWGAETGQSCQTPVLNRDVIYCWTDSHVSLLERHKNYIVEK